MTERRGHRRVAALAAVILLGVVAGVAVGEVFQTDFYVTTDPPIHHNATDGPEVVQTKAYDLLEGNPYTDKSYNLSTRNNGWINVSTNDADSSGMSVTVDEINGTWTNVSSITAPNGQIRLDPSDKNESIVGGTVTTFNFTSGMAPDDGAVDFKYDAPGSANITVRGDFTDGTQYGAVDADTQTGLDVGVANADGQVVFDSVSSGTHDVEVQELGTLTIRNETSPYNKVTGCTASVRFFESSDDDPAIAERTDGDGDGEIDLTGLPVNSEFVATIKCGGYHNRSVIIDDLAKQETAYLLAKDRPAVEVVFEVNDQTGDFGENSKFTVQKAINRSEFGGSPSGFSWSNIGGDRIGATNQFRIDLEDEDRYRLRIESPAGDTRILGAYTADTAEVVTLTIQDVTITIENETAEVQVGFEKDENNNQIDFFYNDTEDETTDLEVVIYERGNASNEIYNQTHDGPLGSLSLDLSLTSTQMNASWVVEFSGTRNGEVIDGQLLTGDRLNDVLPVASWVLEFASVGVILLIPALFGGDRAETGAVVAVAVAGFLWWLQFLPSGIGILTIVLAGTVAIGFKMRQRSRGNIR